MRLRYPLSVCVVSVLSIALVSQLRAWDSGHNSGKAPSPRSGAVGHSDSNLPATSAALSRVSNSYGKIPIGFEANQGQTDSRVRFLAHGDGYSVYLTSSEILLSLQRSHPKPMQQADMQSPLQRRMARTAKGNDVESATVSMRLIGSNPSAQADGAELLPGKVNYLIGKDPQKWHTDIPTYSKVDLKDVYPGVDLVYYGNQEGRLEHDFVVAPKADPKQIEFDVRDGDRTPALSGGELSLQTKAGDLKFRAPVAYQIIGGQRRSVETAYENAGAGRIRFRLGSYDNQQPLVIDPVLVYSAVFGGGDNDLVQGMAIDSERNVYVTGISDPDFPLVDPYQSTFGDSFVTKLNSTGTALVYSTFLGGRGANANTIAVDSEGRAYVAGTDLTPGDIPIVNAYQPTFGGGAQDAFISVLNPAGDALEWSTYLGGPGEDSATATAVDKWGNLYVTGFATGVFPSSHNFSVTECSPNPGGSGCSWVAKFNRAGALQYSTVFAPGSSEAIAADSEGSAYFTGVIQLGSSTEEPLTTPGAFYTKCNPTQYTNICGYVAKLTPAGNSLAYSTTLGATTTSGSAIQVDPYGDAYVAGYGEPGLQMQSNSFQKTFGGGNADGFVLELNPTGTALLASTYLGGSSYDFIQSLALDQYGNVYVSGNTSSPNFPLKAPVQNFVGTNSPSNSTYQTFVATLSSALSSIEFYSTYFGTSFNNAGNQGALVAVDPALNVYLADTDQGNVKPTPGAYAVGATTAPIPYKVFVSKLTIMDDMALTLGVTPSPVAHDGKLIYTISVTSKGPDFGVNVQITDKLPAGTTFVSYNAGGGSCTAPHAGYAGTLHCTLPQLNAGDIWKVKLTVKVGAGSGTTLSNSASTVSNMQDFYPGNNSATIKTKVD